MGSSWQVNVSSVPGRASQSVNSLSLQRGHHYSGDVTVRAYVAVTVSGVGS